MDSKRFKKVDLSKIKSPRLELPETAEQAASKISDIMIRFNIREPWMLAAEACISIQLIWLGLDLLLKQEKIEVVPGQNVSERSKRCQFRWITNLP